MVLLTHGTLGELNVGATAAVAILVPLIAQFDLLLTGSLGPLKAELVAQLQAALQASASIQVPTFSLAIAIQAALQTILALKAQLAAGIPIPTIALDASLSAVAALKLKLQGLELALEAALAIKLQALNAVAGLEAALNFGPVALYGATGQAMAAAALQMSSNDYAGQVGIQDSDTVDFLLIISKTPGFRAAAGVLFPVPPA